MDVGRDLISREGEGDLDRLGWLRRMCQHALQRVCACVCRGVCMPVWAHGCEVWQEGKWAAFSYQDEQESSLRRGQECAVRSPWPLFARQRRWVREGALGPDLRWMALVQGITQHLLLLSRSVSQVLFGHPL